MNEHVDPQTAESDLSPTQAALEQALRDLYVRLRPFIRAEVERDELREQLEHQRKESEASFDRLSAALAMAHKSTEHYRATAESERSRAGKLEADNARLRTILGQVRAAADSVVPAEHVALQPAVEPLRGHMMSGVLDAIQVSLEGGDPVDAKRVADFGARYGANGAGYEDAAR